jgi:hypothetical protein
MELTGKATKVNIDGGPISDMAKAHSQIALEQEEKNKAELHGHKCPPSGTFCDRH